MSKTDIKSEPQGTTRYLFQLSVAKILMTTFAKKIHPHFNINLSQKVIARGQSWHNGSKLTFKMHQKSTKHQFTTSKLKKSYNIWFALRFNACKGSRRNTQLMLDEQTNEVYGTRYFGEAM